MTTLFISDLHLSPALPEITDCFVRFMREEAIHADALYVLGDLFDFWIGDDDRSDFATQIRSEFKLLTSHGVSCYFTQGNRDFLVGKRFAKETGVTLLGDETVIDLYDKKALVLHGDTLCTDDLEYLKFRQTVHQPWLQKLFNRIPLFIKKKIINKVQTDIRSDKQHKPLDIMDVNQLEVERVMEKHQIDLMIHGHTHRPNIHRFQPSERPKMRIVLGDWYTQGSVLVFTKERFTLEVRQFNHFP
ncbi:UDP-2,3-diacylglucosamine diphosphatase [Vibrio hepatarius]|uniref:UDP-2,3-diacylglucosamine diphosphatase n=1 Tax=Vibrio hepatarius TaxID=171383 RepID=UPI001C0A1651|nr:UDP-2,3-diacylglucosamine diphosphatase [Vibrio hepatarius]MBU2895433.1 UDP-2,3-diacylglucosamine diphosphatase [Vibrio hepatarius]